MTGKTMQHIDIAIVLLAVGFVLFHHHKTLLGTDNGLNTPFIATLGSTHQGLTRGLGLSAAGTTQVSGSGQG